VDSCGQDERQRTWPHGRHTDKLGHPGNHLGRHQPNSFPESSASVLLSSRSRPQSIRRRDLRVEDVTGTVPSFAHRLSIISKKTLAVLTPSSRCVGSAFMKRAAARELAHDLRCGRGGRAVSYVLSDMHQLLGMAIGNALEVRGPPTPSKEGPPSWRLCLVLGARCLFSADERPRRRGAVRIDWRSGGSALEPSRSWVALRAGTRASPTASPPRPRAPRGGRCVGVGGRLRCRGDWTRGHGAGCGT
jgi:hypothetical protein